MRKICGTALFLIALFTAGQEARASALESRGPEYKELLGNVFRSSMADPFVYGAAQEGDLPCAVMLGRFSSGSSSAALYGLKTREYGDSGIAVSVRRGGMKAFEILPIDWRDHYSQPEARQLPGRDGCLAVRIPQGGGTGICIEELAAVFPFAGEGGAFRAEAALLTAGEAAGLAAELVEVVYRGRHASIRRKGGGELFAAEADVPFAEPAEAGGEFTCQVRYAFDEGGRPKLMIRPVLSFAQPSPEYGPAYWCGQEIVFAVEVAAPAEGKPVRFRLGEPAAARAEGE